MDSQGPEDAIFIPMPNIFTKVVAAIIANSDGKLNEDMRTVDFMQNPRPVPTSAERRSKSRPDGYLALKDRESGDIHWADIVLSCEYKRKDEDDNLDDVRIHPGL